MVAAKQIDWILQTGIAIIFNPFFHYLVERVAGGGQTRLGPSNRNYDNIFYSEKVKSISDHFKALGSSTVYWFCRISAMLGPQIPKFDTVNTGYS